MRKNVLILGHNDATQFIDIFNQYTRLFDKDKYNVTVAYLTGEENATSRERTIAENVVFLQIPKKEVRGLKINAVRKLLAMTKKNNYDIVICHRYKPSYIMMLVNKLHRIPALFCVMHELRTMQSVGRKLLLAALWQKNIYFAGVSNAVRDDLRRSLWRIPKENIITLYNVIDTDLHEPLLLSRDEARKQLGLHQDDYVFGNIGRLARNKDQKSLIHAFTLIKPYCPNAKLIIMGDGELESRLKQQIIENGLEKDVILTGFLPNAANYIKAFDCFVLCSIQEAFGRVLIEAMLAKCPIIATAVNGIPEVVADAGKLIKAKNPELLAHEMKNAYMLPQDRRDEIAENAYKHVYDNFSIPAFKRDFWQIPVLNQTSSANQQG